MEGAGSVCVLGFGLCDCVAFVFLYEKLPLLTLCAVLSHPPPALTPFCLPPPTPPTSTHRKASRILGCDGRPCQWRRVGWQEKAGCRRRRRRRRRGYEQQQLKVCRDRGGGQEGGREGGWLDGYSRRCDDVMAILIPLRFYSHTARLLRLLLPWRLVTPHPQLHSVG